MTWRKALAWAALGSSALAGWIPGAVFAVVWLIYLTDKEAR